MDVKDDTRKQIDKLRLDLYDPEFANILDMLSFSMKTKRDELLFNDVVHKIVAREEYIMLDY